MTIDDLQNKLYAFTQSSYPDIKIEVRDNADKTRSIFFTTDKFKYLYPKQRYHYLCHLIPVDFYKENLETAAWFELAPGENTDDLDYHDDETIDEIKETILSVLNDKTDFVSFLDNEFTGNGEKCFGDFRHSKKILTDKGFSDTDQFDIFHVLMKEGAFCDCEILYNVFKESEYSKRYWRNKQK